MFRNSLVLSLLILSLVFPVTLSAQQLTVEQRAKLGPRLQSMVQNTLQKKQGKPKASMPKAFAVEPTGATSEGEKLYVTAVYTDHPETLQAAGIHVNSEFSDFVTARVSVSQIQQLAGMQEVERVRAPARVREEADGAVGLSGARVVNEGLVNNTEYTGKGVLACMVGFNNGIDWTHRDFRGIEDTTKSRILRIWDQSLDPSTEGGTSPSGYDYGVEYTRTDIEDELDGSPEGFVQTEYKDSHESHVMGTFAGNGGALPTRRYSGMAPEADIVFVKASIGGGSLLDGMSYCEEVAESQNRPVVVNLSWGGYTYLPRDGTGTFAQAANDISGPGRAVVTSAGNGGNGKLRHGTGSIEAGEEVEFEFDLHIARLSSIVLELWFDKSSEVTAEITSPSGKVAVKEPNGGAWDQDTLANEGEIRARNGVHANQNGDRHLPIVMRGYVEEQDTTKLSTGTWTVTLKNNSDKQVSYDAWLNQCLDRASPPAQWDNKQTITAPGTAEDAIAVGAYTHRRTWTDQSGRTQKTADSDQLSDIAPFSSRGPTRDGRMKPDVTAPGTNVASTLSSGAHAPSSYVLPGGKHLVMSGTSMSSPVVAGAVALLFQENPNLTPDQIETLLEEPARRDSRTGGVPNSTWGSGKLDALGSVVRAVNSSARSASEILAYDDEGGTSTEQVTGEEKVAVRFTPSISGKVTGIRIRPSETVNVEDSLTLEVWTNGGKGLPDEKLGSTVKYAGDYLLPYSWNYLDLSDIEVDVESGTDYHVVMGIPSSGDEMSISVDDGSPDGRSSKNDGSGWVAKDGQDYRIRTQVARTTGVSGALPVDIASLEGTATENGVRLTWQTASEEDNAGFEVQRKRAGTESAWKEIAFVNSKAEGGTTDEPLRYRFADEDLPFAADQLTYRLRQVDLGGTESFTDAVTIERSVDQVELLSTYPNPASQQATVRYALPDRQEVSLKLYDMLGREVRTIAEGKREGRQKRQVDVSGLPSGAYFLRLQADGKTRTQRLTVVR